MNTAIKMSIIPGFTDTALLRAGGKGANVTPGTVGINRNHTSPTNLVFSIAPDLCVAAGLTDEDKVSIMFKGTTFIVVKGGHRLLAKEGLQLRCTTSALYLIEERVRVAATVVPADLTDPANPVPAYIQFTLPTTAKKNPKYFKMDAGGGEVMDVPDNEGADFDDSKN